MEGTVPLCTHETRRQRSHWIDMAREFPGTAVWAIVFDIPYEVSAKKKNLPAYDHDSNSQMHLRFARHG